MRTIQLLGSCLSIGALRCFPPGSGRGRSVKTASLWILFLTLTLPLRMAGQTPPLPADAERPVTLKQLFPNILHDQEQIWSFPARLGHTRTLIPTAAVLSVGAGLVALDPQDAPYFRRTTSFDGFNRAFSGSNTSYGIIAAPASLFVVGLLRKDSKMQKTALLAGEAIADSEILTTVFKDSFRRVRPIAVPAGENYSVRQPRLFRTDDVPEASPRARVAHARAPRRSGCRTPRADG